MSPDLAGRGASISAAVSRPERRLHSRYSVEVNVYYQAFRDHEAVRTGSGKTSDLSTGGVFFRADHILPTGLDVELSIDWPSASQEIPSLQLVIFGKVARSSGSGNAVRITSHAFRIRGPQVTMDRHSTSRRGCPEGRFPPS
jgi:hypothetical protein